MANKSIVRRGGLVNIFTQEYVNAHPGCISVVDEYDQNFIIGKMPSQGTLRLLFGTPIGTDYFYKEGEEWKKFEGVPKSIHFEDMRDGKMKWVTNIDEVRLAKDIASIKILPESSDIYDVLVNAGLFRSRTDVKNNWKQVNKEIDCGTTELLNVGKVRENIFVYKDYPED
jgi:hypothetical protein